MKWFILALFRIFDYRGRSRRKEFWYFYLLDIIFSVLLTMLELLYPNGVVKFLVGTIFFILAIVYLPLHIRRLHDLNKSWWWILTVIPAFVFMFFDSCQGANKWGKYPKNENGDLKSLCRFYGVKKFC